MDNVIAILRQVPTLFLMPLLPEGYRKKWPWEPSLQRNALVYATTLMHVAASALFWMLAFTSYQKGFGDAIAERLADPSGTGEVPTANVMGQEVTTLNWIGIFGFFAFFFTLKGMLAWTYLVDSVFRSVKAATMTEFSGSVFLCVPLWLYDLACRRLEMARMDRLYGKAGEPDRIKEVGGNLLVRSNRPHEEWHGLLAFRFNEKLYKLDVGKEGSEGARKCFEYRFIPWPESEIVRHIVVLGNT